MTSRVRNEYDPTRVSPPGQTLADILAERGIAQAELARRMGRPLKTVNEIVKGKAAIVPETAIQLERALGAPAAFWLAREAAYREWLARAADLRQLEADTGWLAELPLAHMIRHGWVAKLAPRARQVAECLRFFGVASVAVWRAQCAGAGAAFRLSAAHAAAPGAVWAWLRQGEREAAARECAPFHERRLSEALPALRSLTRERDPRVFLPRLGERLAAAGVALAVVRAPKGCPASGATRFLTPERAMLLLSFRYLADDQFWFSVFHEIGHLLLHGRKAAFVEGAGPSAPAQTEADSSAAEAQRTAAEAEADRFAAEAIVPPAEELRLRTLGGDEAAIRAFAAELGIAPGLIVGRLQHDRRLPFGCANGLKVRYTWPVVGSE